MKSAAQAIYEIQQGNLTSEAYVAQCAAAVEQHEPRVQALAHYDAEATMAAARQADQAPWKGVLHGIPVIVKDVFDTQDLPTTFNSPLYEGAQPVKDAAIVSILKAAGAIVFAKATTVEFASLGQVPPTTNPLDPTRTPGGSSSGSAAAVAAGMAPLAIGTQTGGSTIRPASFCGLAAMKPTFGTVPIEGMRPYAPSLDTVGWMARNVDDLALLHGVFKVSASRSAEMGSPRVGVYPTAYWDQAETDTHEAIAAAADALAALGATVSQVSRVPGDDRLNEAQDIIMHGEGRAAFLAEYKQWPERLHPAFVDEVRNANGYDANQLRWAYDHLAAMRMTFDQVMTEFDVLLTPSVPGEAPVGLESTGDAVFNRLWTGLHMPAVTLPGYTGSNGLPVGVQLVAPRFNDRQLLETASFAQAAIAKQLQE